jgi:hypothetical protein
MKGGAISALPQFDVTRESYFCPNCGLPRDYEHFDESGFADTPRPGRKVVLARFELRPQYCGLLENFSQFTNQLGQIETPGLQWIITVNNRPLYPYIKLDYIANPWGYGGFGVSIRLDENSTIEFVVRNLDYSASEIKRIGGRIVGRSWYNSAYGDATPHACRFK